MDNQRIINEGLLLEDQEEIYKNVQDLYEQAKSIWKGVLFEILLDPINPAPGELPERHIIDYKNCMEDFEEDDNEKDDRMLSLNDLFDKIQKLQDYKNILIAVLEAIEVIKEEYKGKYTVTLLRVLDHTNQVNQDAAAEVDANTDNESLVESEIGENEEWEAEWESDSGVESPPEYNPHALLYSSASEEEFEPDSGLQTESEGEERFNLDAESSRSSTPEDESISGDENRPDPDQRENDAN